jgi:hypothetical protein
LQIRIVAAIDLLKLSKAEHSAPEWQDSMQGLMLVARSGPMMLARIGVMRALHRHDIGKSYNWGKRKLKLKLKRGTNDQT